MPEAMAEDAFVVLRQGLYQLREDVAWFVNSQGITPAPSSRAEIEAHSFAAPGAMETVWSQVGLLNEICGDQITAFAKLIKEPVETLAPWSCSRALLEAAALAAWLLDPGIDAKSRVQRSFALRYEGLLQQKKFARAASDAQALQAVKRRISHVENQALASGFRVAKNTKGKSIGIGEAWPTMTEIIRRYLDEEVTYRLMSAVAHGHLWAVQQVSFDLTSPTGLSGRKALEKRVNVTAVYYLAYSLALAFTRPIWYQSAYYGWDCRILTSRLDRSYNLLGIPEDRRFWKG